MCVFSFTLLAPRSISSQGYDRKSNAAMLTEHQVARAYRESTLDYYLAFSERKFVFVYFPSCQMTAAHVEVNERFI